VIIVVAALRFESQEDRDRAVALIADVQMVTRKEEPGCRDYCFAPDPAVPTRIQVFEMWEDGESLAAHFEHPNYVEMVKRLSSAKIQESINQAYLIEALGSNDVLGDAEALALLEDRSSMRSS
jgi:quinol monooxygenase YgiN